MDAGFARSSKQLPSSVSPRFIRRRWGEEWKKEGTRDIHPRPHETNFKEALKECMCILQREQWALKKDVELAKMSFWVPRAIFYASWDVSLQQHE